MQLSTRLAARACHLVRPLSLVNDFGVGAESSGSLKTRLIQMQAECPWVVVANSKDMAVHAALLSTGKVLYFGGYDVDDTHLYDTQTAQITDIPKFGTEEDQPEGQPPWTNIFCGGQAWLPDGRLLVAGGMLPEDVCEAEAEEQEQQHVHAAGMRCGGERGCWIFDPWRSSWSPTADLNLDPTGNPNSGGRWYPTLVTLHDGRILAVGGHPDRRERFPPEDPRHNNNTPERYSMATGVWTLLTAEAAETQEDSFVIDSYPRLHLLPGGDLFFSTLSKGSNRRFDAHAGTFVGDAIDPHADVHYAEGSNATSVLLPLLHGDGYQPRVMVCGGTQPERIDLVDRPERPDERNGVAWQPTGMRALHGALLRHHLCAVILPTGQVFVTGGTATAGDDGVQQTGAVRQGEVYDPGIDWDSSTYLPGTGEWAVVEQATVRRHYHSSALLLPDGAVWTAGSNGGGTGPELKIELYRPAYMGQVARPRIEESPAAVTYRSTFSVRVRGAGAIRRVALMRNGTVTHAFDGDQRYVDLEFRVGGDDLLAVVAPPDPSVAPPGYYMLWAIDLDADGKPRPCHQARFVHVGGMSVRLTAAGCGIQFPLSLRQDILGFGSGQGGTSVRRQLLRMLLEC